VCVFFLGKHKPTDLPNFSHLTRGFLPWRPDAVCSTTGLESSVGETFYETYRMRRDSAKLAELFPTSAGLSVSYDSTGLAWFPVGTSGFRCHSRAALSVR